MWMNHGVLLLELLQNETLVQTFQQVEQFLYLKQAISERFGYFQ